LPIAYDRLWVGGYVYRKKIRIWRRFTLHMVSEVWSGSQVKTL
jgi:hypothetical protein